MGLGADRYSGGGLSGGGRTVQGAACAEHILDRDKFLAWRAGRARAISAPPILRQSWR